MPAAEQDRAALTVTPATRLFDVSLRPGETALAAAQLRNDSQTELRIRLAPEQVAWTGHDRALESLWIAARHGSECDAAAMADLPRTPMASASSLDLGSLPAGAFADVCLLVTFPEAGETQLPAVSTVDLVFTGTEIGNTQTGPLEVSGDTGSTRRALALLAAVLVLLGIAIAPRRRSANSAEA